MIEIVFLVMFGQNRFLDTYLRFLPPPNAMRWPTEMEEQNKFESKKTQTKKYSHFNLPDFVKLQKSLGRREARNMKYLR